MASRFPETVTRKTGALGASQRRLSATTTTKLGGTGQSVVRSGSTGIIRRHSMNATTTETTGARSGDTSTLAKELKRSSRTLGDWPEAASAGGFCQLCGEPLTESGKGLSLCLGCRSLQLKSGRASHVRSTSKEGSCGPKAKEDLFALDPGTAPSGHVGRGAWRRMSMRKDGELADDVVEHAGPAKIMAGFIDTGFKVGDRVKSKFRPAGAAEGDGWNPLNTSSDEAVVLGQGHKAGEVLVKFDHGDVKVSLKLHQLEHAAAQAPVSNIERTVARRRASKSVTRASTIGE